ncbi:TetR family transcriptional regulator [Lacticaseibacillus casei]|nr:MULTISPECIES: TetR/AcrR family transcriptional regulator [Lacticaseibacillus]KLI74633.1 TetR family transcriptional regulator [Lacticaseibacillus casei]OLS06301.1 TetR family transcriptional regulator [Lacticaseibacillus casei]QVI33424.1 TetR/AcrR family transcriptional regulator [Lacticaseibacillus zeae]TLF42409.1 TetR/AcrR family transcriptional regulator [Lacticaseibacillus zeae]
MVLSTFEHLDENKQQRILAALVTEFSKYPLAQAQVARIVKQADIARGAFYKYFSDLKDAYQYAFKEVIGRLHTGIAGPEMRRDPYAATVAFLQEADESQDRDFIRLHFTKNSGMVTVGEPPIAANAMEWAVTTLCHSAISQALANPEQADLILKNLKAALLQLHVKES